MRPYRAVLLALCVVGGALVAAVPAGATDSMDIGTTSSALDADHAGLADAEPVTPANNSTNASLGADISSFMQSSAAEVGGAVETGMWTAAFNATRNESTQVSLVERQTGELRSQLSDIERRKAELVTERETGDLTETAYKAKIGHLIGRIDALRAAIDAVSERAEQVNAEVETLDTLRTETENLSGPEIAAVARNLTGVGEGPHGTTLGPGNAPGNGASVSANGTNGPPEDIGNGTNGPPNGVGNGTNSLASEPSNGTNGPSNGVGNGGGAAAPANGTDGTPNEVNNGTGGPSDGGPSATTSRSQQDPAGQQGPADKQDPSDERGSSNQSGPPSDSGGSQTTADSPAGVAGGAPNATTAASFSVAALGDSTPILGAAPMTDLAEGAVNALDAAAGAIHRAASAIPV